MQPTRTPKLAPYLLVHDAEGLSRFIERALGGEVTFQARRRDGTIGHAELRIADSLVMIADSPRDGRTFPAMLHLYVPDVDEAFVRARKEGASTLREPEDQSDGDRRGSVRDAWGNEWWFTTPSRG